MSVTITDTVNGGTATGACANPCTDVADAALDYVPMTPQLTEGSNPKTAVHR